MNHNGAMVLIVRPNIGKIEAFGEVVVDLHGTQLPLSSDHVLHHEVDFRSVKSRFAKFLHIINVQCSYSLSKCLFGFVPTFRVTYILVGIRVSRLTRTR